MVPYRTAVPVPFRLLSYGTGKVPFGLRTPPHFHILVKRKDSSAKQRSRMKVSLLFAALITSMLVTSSAFSSNGRKQLGDGQAPGVGECETFYCLTCKLCITIRILGICRNPPCPRKRLFFLLYRYIIYVASRVLHTIVESFSLRLH